MTSLELSRPMRRIVEELCAIESTDQVAIVTDEERLDLGMALTAAVRSTGATGILLIMPQTKNHGDEPPAIVADGLIGADAAFVMTTYSFTHTDAYRRAQESGTRLTGMRGVTRDMFLTGPINTDFDELDRITRRLKAVLSGVSSVRVTSDEGTDVTFTVGEQPVFSIATRSEISGGVNFPGGEAAVAPDETTAAGTIVIDHSMDGVGLLETPIELDVVDGHVVDISGGREAIELRSLLESADENAGNIAEFAIGTNPDARLIGNVKEAKKRYGTVHFAVGDNMTLGGTVSSDIHLDGVIRSPNVYVDGDLLVSDSELHLDRFEAD